ncbi:succinylglutamate desuccinylase/aspartoacylase family protein [Crocosphaera sp.]|uniref:succinylglutamate desuccinylase/aspartoacylase domain-containing protein n=1 Tax=Crocosphaera sp. TaxID=2729996 RepID=UPI0026282DF5|nr:succinylglutamate desuccinylase/aspartoacylase family protein [Crocosphaera sp.]MDJ0580115.1 succinylglutamate desuccinylase/aspartoacylase family protein [Crocosphaera sp.]
MRKVTIKNNNCHINIFDTELLGATVCLVAGVHGNELCGLQAIKTFENQLLTCSPLVKGRLITIIANCQAIQHQKRFIDYDLNRSFGNSKSFGHELSLAKELTPFLQDVDYLIDLHSTSAPTNPFCAGTLTEEHLKLFSMTGIQFYTCGWEIHRGHTMLIDEVDRSGGIGIIVECGQHDADNTNRVAYDVIVSVLDKLKMLKLTKSSLQNSTSNTVVKIKKIIKSQTHNFYFIRHFENFVSIAENEIVAYDGDTAIRFPYGYLMVMPTHGRLKQGEEAFGIGIP